jgi:hypothetical protein
MFVTPVGAVSDVILPFRLRTGNGRRRFAATRRKGSADMRQKARDFVEIKHFKGANGR